MPLTGKTADEIAELENSMRRGVPADGGGIGNKRLRDEVLRWDEPLYLAVRKRLLDSGDLLIGRGKGGSVRRAVIPAVNVETVAPQVAVEAAAAAEEERFLAEAALYPPMAEVIKTRWAIEQPFDQVLVENTDRGGRRKDGIWTRPDVTVAAMTSYTYVPGRHFDIITFEIKHHEGLNVTAVYEALAHRRAATRSYVLVYIPDHLLEGFEANILKEIGEEASRHGIGLIVAGDPSDYDTWEVREEASRENPDPARMNSFIRNQLSDGTREQIVRWFRI